MRVLVFVFALVLVLARNARAEPGVGAPMERTPSLRWAALAAGLGASVAGALLYRHQPLLGPLAVLPLVIGLGGLFRRQTWGGFTTLAGGVLLAVAAWAVPLPPWAALVGVAGAVVAGPAVFTALRYDATAASVWLALATVGGAGAALAGAELASTDPTPTPLPTRVVFKDPSPAVDEPADDHDCDRWAWRGWGAQVDVDVCDGFERHRRHRHGPRRHRHRHWR